MFYPGQVWVLKNALPNRIHFATIVAAYVEVKGQEILYKGDLAQPGFPTSAVKYNPTFTSTWELLVDAPDNIKAACDARVKPIKPAVSGDKKEQKLVNMPIIVPDKPAEKVEKADEPKSPLKSAIGAAKSPTS